MSWKRITDASGEPKSFGICEFEDPESLLRCWRLLNNMNLLGSQLKVRIDLKSEDFIAEWRDYKKTEWIQKQRKMGVEIDTEDFFNRERSGELMEWEQEIIGDKEKIYAEIKDIIEKKEVIHEVAEHTEDYMRSLSKSTDYSVSEHPREKERERRKKFREEERQKKFERLLEAWREKEREREKEKAREKEKEAKRLREKQKLIQDDLNYDPAAEKKLRKKDPERYKRLKEERKRNREKEREEDEQERLKEEEEKKQEELRRIKQEEEERKRKEWEERNAFTQVEVENVPTATPVTSQGNIILTTTKDVPTVIDSERFETEAVAMEEEESQKAPIELPTLNETTKDALNKIEGEVQMKLEKEEKNRTQAQRILANLDKDEEVKRQVEMAKKIYEEIPIRKNELYKYPLNWEILEGGDIINNKLRPWVAKQTLEYLGVEENNVINLIVRNVIKKLSPQQIEDKLETFLQDDAEIFVTKMWKFLVFEQLKVERGLIKSD